jgi:hypothetical protein
MSLASIDSHLDLLEERFNTLAGALIDGSAESLQAASSSLQLLAVELVRMLEAGGQGPLVQSACSRRIQSLTAGLAVVRESLLRQSAYVDRALELIVPAAQQKATYSGSRTYGGSIRQSGAFKVLAA